MRKTKKALVLSALSLLACVSMLIGSTFAWFTDSVASTNNIIKSGNLDVELYYQVEGQSDWTKVTENTNIFKEDALWEPGHTEVIKLKVVNEGSLALKYNLGVNIASEVGSVNVLDDNFQLSDYIKYGVVAGAQSYTRDQAIAAVDANADTLKTPYTTLNSLKAKEEAIVTMVVYMPTTVGNEANHAKGAAVPTIKLGINLFATQYTSEKDSFDEMYDKASAAFTVEDANAMLADNLDTTLANCIEPTGVLSVPANYTGTLTLVNSTIKSVQAAGDANIVILGDVVINAKAEATTFAAVAFDGSAISAKGDLSISGKGNLTAIAADVNGAFGIGGVEATSVSIEDITIDYVSGGYAYGVGTDLKYYKDAPEGGAAIGSAVNGADISLKNVTITKAIGGSKAAAIGARYHVGVDVTINNSVIAYAEGGVSAAAIGGSRVSNGASENGTTINITKSTITAQGGAYGAGIGSGYDTHCQKVQPLCTINITDSVINAKGGQYAAGVGTGYHNAALAGEIKGSTINAASGEKFYKSTYTSAMDIGFGVTDPAREGIQTDSKLIVDGTVLSIKDAPITITVSSAAELTAAINNAKAGDTIMLNNDVEASSIIMIDKSIVIEGNGHKVSSTASRVFRVTATDVNVTLNNVNMVSNAVRVSSNDIRGISVDSDLTNVVLTLNDCSVDFTDASAHDWAYAVNVVGGTGYKVFVNGGTYEGANVINIRGAGQTVVVKNATLNSLYLPSAYENMYGACIYVVQNASSSLEAVGNTFNGGNAVAINAGYTPVVESNNVDNTVRSK